MPPRVQAVQLRRGWAALLALSVLGAALAAGLRSQRARADFVFTGGGEVRALDPHAATGVPEGRAIRALFEGLVVRDPVTLLPAPGCAESWSVSDDELVYTFALRENARWSNGDAVTAQDFVWTWTRLLDPATAAEYAAQLWCVEGAREFATGRDASGAEAPREREKLGFRALDERTFEVRLVEPTPRFLDILCFYAFVPLHRASLEAVRERHPSTWNTQWTRPEHLVSNGAYSLRERRINERLRLEKSPHYWNADAVAMRVVDMLSLESWSSALNLYLTGEIDWVDGAIPSNLVAKLTAREDFRATPYLGVYFYRLNTTRPPLDDARVRRALSRAIQRAEIAEKVLKAGQAPSLTFTPWGAIGDYRAPQMQSAVPAGARGDFAAAGYSHLADAARKFPTLEIHFNTSETHRAVAEVVAHHWKQTLGVETRLRNQEWKAFLDAQSNLDYDVSRSSWIADYADPGNFLEIWTSDSPNNRTGWRNAQYDELIASARRERDATERNVLYVRAERLLLDEAPCIPIYSYVSQNLVDPRIGGFDDNLLNEPALSKLYWRDDDELGAARKDAPTARKRVASHGPREGLRSPAAERARAEVERARESAPHESTQESAPTATRELDK
jgi:oligopeptide transport system substrate-binding protein